MSNYRRVSTTIPHELWAAAQKENISWQTALIHGLLDLLGGDQRAARIHVLQKEIIVLRNKVSVHTGLIEGIVKAQRQKKR